MAKLADAIHFDYIEELCDEVLNRLNEDDETSVSVIGTYEGVRAFIKEFMTYDEVEFKSLVIDDPEYDNYYDEYIVGIWNDDGKVLFNCEPAKRNDRYINCEGNVLYLLDDVKQTVLNTCEYDEIYFVIIGEDEFEEDCDECNCCCEDKSSQDNWAINVTCNLDTKEANKLIDEMEKKLLRVNDIFKEINTMKSFFGW